MTKPLVVLVKARCARTNSIKDSADGLALKVTEPARTAGMVLKNADGKVIWLADIYVYGFDALLEVVDADTVSASDRVGLVASAARDTDGIYRGTAASVQIAGNGYRVQLPGCEVAGFSEGDRAPVIPAQGLLLIHDGTQRRLAEDLKHSGRRTDTIGLCDSTRVTG